MNTPFPGMDPYLEHPILWEGVHARLINALADQLQPRLDPRYVTSIEERVFIEGPQRRVPDLWIQRSPDTVAPMASSQIDVDAAVILDIEEIEIRESRIEILDAQNEIKLVAMIELLSPTNKTTGPGRESYRQKQHETLERDCHLIEIDLLRRGQHVLSVPEWKLKELGSFDSIVCVSRWTARQRFEVYPRGRRQRLPRIQVPLTMPDPDVPLDIQAALEEVYIKGRYVKRVRYSEPCDPPLSREDQPCADDCWTAYRNERPELFPVP